jgi:UTP--glucose-1-phosphate uridylyltransferase
MTDLVLRLSIFSVDQQILQHMIDTQAEFIMEVTDKTKADVKVNCDFFLSGHTRLAK